MASFLFVDEGHSSATEYFSLTGVLLPLAQYADARTHFHQLLLRFQESGRWTVNREYMELHGFKMLHWIEGVDDDLKLETFAGIADIIGNLGLRVYRVGGIRQAFPEPLRHPSLFLRYCWGEMLRSLDPLLVTEMVIPVMDMQDGPSITAVSGLMTFVEQMRAVGKHEHLGMRGLENVAGEVFYADSKFSFGIQLADVVGYLRQCSDRLWLGKELTEFQGLLNNFSAYLDPHVTEYRLGVPQIEHFTATIPVAVEDSGGGTQRDAEA